MKALFQLFKLALLFCPLLCSLESHAQSADFKEATSTFFTTPKNYSIESFTIKMLGPSGVYRYAPGEASFTVGNNSFKYILKDGKETTHTYSPQLKTVKVLTSRGDIDMPMFILQDGDAVRAIQYNDGHYVVYHYVKNISSGKYVNNDWFTLRQ